MASPSKSTTGDEPKNELKNASHELNPRPSSSAKPSPQSLCSSIFNRFALFSPLSVFSPTNSASAEPVTNGHPTNVFEEVAPSPYTSGTSVPNKKPPYDVFINYRSLDVKETLAIPLYNTLIGMGFRVFLDSEELELGDFFPSELEAAMRSAWLHIAVFSENYAQSPWCLAELSFMVKTGSKIIPVFYHVLPQDVRYVKGVFAEAFSRHEKKRRYTRKKLQEWKNALKIVSFNVGQTIDSKDDEGKLLKNIVNRVLKSKI